MEGPQTPPAHSSASRTFSFHSDRSGGSRPKDDLTESPREKQRRDSIWKSNSKANPNAALTEAQPGAPMIRDLAADPPQVNAIFEESTIAPLRSVQHKDAHGNVITDPDLSNPTRPRMERPLDTIRSFEAAIDTGYKRRSNYNRAESYEQGNGVPASRRNSSYGFDGQPNSNRYPNGNGGGYYGGGRQDQYGLGLSGRSRFGRGMQSDPSMRPYPPQHGHFPSQDTANTGVTNGTDSTGPWNSNTDPSSENSSIDKNYPQNGYGPISYNNGFPGPIPEDGAYPMRNGAPPVQPPNGQRRPIPLGNSPSAPLLLSGELPSTKRPDPEKRKSWLGRRFSKKN